MAVNAVGGAKQQPQVQTAELVRALLEAANRAVANKELEDGVPAPTDYDAKGGVDLKVSQRDQREHGVLSRRAFNVGGQLYIQDTVMKSNGDTEERWKMGKRPLTPG